MSLLDLLGKATLGTGVKAPSSYTKKVQAKELPTTSELTSAATTGYAFRSATLGSSKYTDSAPAPMEDSLLSGTSATYQEAAFKDKMNGKNKLLSSKGNTYAFRPGNFQTDIATYTERIFLRQQQAAGQGSNVPASLISIPAQTVPVLTATAVPGSPAGMPTNDGRYIPTVGYGFVLYGTLVNGGYSS